MAQVLGFLHPFFLVLLQLFPMMNPAWYYAVNAGSNLVSWTTISLVREVDENMSVIKVFSQSNERLFYVKCFIYPKCVFI